MPCRPFARAPYLQLSAASLRCAWGGRSLYKARAFRISTRALALRKKKHAHRKSAQPLTLAALSAQLLRMAAGLLTLAFWATAALEGREGQVTVLDDVAVANTAAKAHTYKARMHNKRVLTSKANRIDGQHGYDAPNSSDGAGSRNGDDSRGEPERMVDADGFPLEYILDAPATMSNSSATKPSRGNTCLITVVDDKTKEAYGATLASIVDNRLLYCARNQYTHLFFKPENISQQEMHGRLGYWRKVVAIQAAFTRHDCAYAVFLDTDVVITIVTSARISAKYDSQYYCFQ